MSRTIGEYAALVHKDMCENENNGYSWDPRWGEDGKGIRKLVIDGYEFTYDQGSYECGTSAVTAWKSVLRGSKYEKALDGYQYTGNLLPTFLGTGLFEKKPMSFLAEPGDMYLNIENHVAMCQTQEPDILSEFRINENGGVYGGQVGDQTGGESVVRSYYDYEPNGWDCIVHAKHITLEEIRGIKPTVVTTKDTSSKCLHGIDIASHQTKHDINVANVDADFVIIKVTGGDWYVNDRAHNAKKDWRQVADEAIKAGKLVGFYHYALEKGTTANAKKEAEFFLRELGDYAYKGILALDWEAEATGLPVSYAKAWLDYVAKQTGATPLFYSQASVINHDDFSAIKGYPLWMASYLNRYEGISGYVDKPVNTWKTGAWSKMTIYQYSSESYIKGYHERLDVNVFYGTRTDWEKLIGRKGSSGQPTLAPSKDNPVIYCVSTDSSGIFWYNEMHDLREEDGTDDYAGDKFNFIRWIAIKDAEYRAYTRDSGWLPWVTNYDPTDLENGCAGDGSPIRAIEIKNKDIRCQVYVDNAWYDWMIGQKDTGGSSDTYAGDLRNPITAVRIERVK